LRSVSDVLAQRGLTEAATRVSTAIDKQASQAGAR
jgi:hypothetical protein